MKYDIVKSRENSKLNESYEEYARLIRQLEVSANLDNPVFGRGPLDAKIMIIGEAPGKDEAEQGKPFVGKAGKTLDSLLEIAEVDRSKVYLTNAVKYRPIKPNTNANRTPTNKEILFSLDLLNTEIKVIEPKLIVTLGNSPLFAVSQNLNLKVGDVHGRILDFQDVKLFPMYHPASVIYNRELKQVLENDALEFGKLAKKW